MFITKSKRVGDKEMRVLGKSKIRKMKTKIELSYTILGESVDPD